EHERDRGWTEAGRHGHRVYGPVLARRLRTGDRTSIPQTLHVPAVLLAVEVQVPDRASAGLDAPVLAVAPVVPPPTLDAPAADHVDHLVPPPAPFEHRRHPRVALDPHLLVVSLRHVAPPSVVESNTCSRWRRTVSP